MRDDRGRRSVWVVSELYFPEETSTGHVLTELAEGLSEHYRVRVLCGQPSYAARGRRAPSREHRNGVDVIRCAGTTFDKDRLLLRIVNMMTLGLSIVASAIRHIRPGDVVLVVTTPPLLPFGIVFASRFKRAASVLMVHDLYPNAAVAAGLLKPESRVTRLLDWLHRQLYDRVDRISVCGRDMRSMVLKKMAPAAADRVVAIPNWADQLKPSPTEDNELVRQLKLEGKFILLHAGNIGRVQAIESMLEAAENLVCRDPAVHFLFIGNGSKKQWLESNVRGRGLTNVTILPHLPRSDQQMFLNAGHVIVFGFVPGMMGVGVPSRLYNAMSVGRPIVAMVDNESEPALVIREERIGWVVPPNHPAAFADAVMAARSDSARLLEMGERARLAFEQRYQRSHAIQAYRTLIDGLSYHSS